MCVYIYIWCKYTVIVFFCMYLNPKKISMSSSEIEARFCIFNHIECNFTLMINKFKI